MARRGPKGEVEGECFAPCITPAHSTPTLTHGDDLGACRFDRFRVVGKHFQALGDEFFIFQKR